ncbi:MAG: thiamine-phosphate kinase [Hyphomicrobiales bacterium]|nr:thiamine-phosphate kinase [Hyphomicrobiales bacterium]
MTRSGEFDWIATYLAPLAAKNSFGLKDDAALLDVPDGQSLIVTQDAIAEGIHFLPNDPLDLVARKALRVNISDVVAKGARPHAYSMALGVPDAWQDNDMQLFAEGLAADQAAYGLSLTGGDTFRSPERLSVSVTMFALIDEKAYRSRLGAKPGDLIFVTGTIGKAAFGLQVATGKLAPPAPHHDFLLNAYRLPDPPLAAAEIVAQFATASMDISDGLIGDCRKLCTASSVDAVLVRDRVPLSPAVAELLAQDDTCWKHVLTGGDDYQVLCAVDPADASAFQRKLGARGVRISHIGEIKASNNVGVALDINGVEVSIEEDSYTHF